MRYVDVIKKVSEELDIPEKIVDRVYKSYWLFIRNTIKDLPLKNNLSEEEFLKLRTNFNIPSLGKLHCTYERLLNMKKRFDYINRMKGNGIVE